MNKPRNTHRVSSINLARDRLARKAQVVKDAFNNPQGKALIDLLKDEYGHLPNTDNQFRANVNYGHLEVIQWLEQMANFDPMDPRYQDE